MWAMGPTEESEDIPATAITGKRKRINKSVGNKERKRCSFAIMRSLSCIFYSFERKKKKQKVYIKSLHFFSQSGEFKDFLYSNSGLAMVRHYGYNPHRIVKDGFAMFSDTMQKAAHRIRELSGTQYVTFCGIASCE